MNKWIPAGLFTAFFIAVIGATLYFAPSWGLMDDYQNVRMANDIWSSPHPYRVLADNFMGAGMFRPVYFSWIAVFYYIFQHWPTGFYIFNTICNMAAMLFWGGIFYHLFNVRRQDYYWTVFFFPLTFFVFTAFWNIFNYISLQEKLIVLFAPLAIYFFQKTYRDFRWQDLVLTYVFLALGLYSKATCIFIPLIFLAYACLDLLLFHYRSKLSWISVFINGIIFSAYAFFTVTVQLHQTYTEKYKANLGAGAFLKRVVHLAMVMKFMLVVGLIGAFAVVIYSVRKKRPEFSLSILIYLGLAAYVLLLAPWGAQSYLLSATGPLVMGALFPVYDWFNRKGGMTRIVLNGGIAVVLCVIFAGNIVPNISRMADIGHAITFLCNYQKDSAGQDLYFMPPPFSESAFATGRFTGKNVIFCPDGKISADLLSLRGGNYIVFSDYFPAITLADVAIGEQIFSNPTWRVFRLQKMHGYSGNFAIPVEQNCVQRLKIKIRNLY